MSWATHIALSFTHSRLLKHRTGPTVTPGTFPIEGDLAESWARTSDTTYVLFKLRRDLLDRADDMIISGGYNIWPMELESSGAVSTRAA